MTRPLPLLFALAMLAGCGTAQRGYDSLAQASATWELTHVAVIVDSHSIRDRHARADGRLAEPLWKEFLGYNREALDAEALVEVDLDAWTLEKRKPRDFDAHFDRLKKVQKQIASMAEGLAIP